MSESDVYVHVLYDFCYLTEDRIKIKIKKGEELLLVKKSNVDWWQVIRSSEDHPFYAPSSYLSVVGNNCCSKSSDVNANFKNVNDHGEDNENTKHMKSLLIEDASKNTSDVCNHLKIKHDPSRVVTGPLSFNNPLCVDEGFKCDSNENLVEQKTQKHEALSTSGSCQNSKTEDSSLVEDPLSPIYVNIPHSLNRLPPIPSLADTPIRALPNDWFEYMDESGRKFYFHTISGKVTWKPPRRHETYQSTPVSSKQNSPKFNNSSITVPKPPPKQLKPKLQKLAVSSHESLESFTILPHGWSQEQDTSSGSVYYRNELCSKKWYSSLDENGRTYFYDEDSSESVWELPEISVSDTQEFEKCEKNESGEPLSLDNSLQKSPMDPKASNASSATSSPKIRRKAPKLPVARQFKTRSMVVPECVNLSSTEDNKGFLPPSFGEGYWPSVQDGHFSITRKGTLNKTKLVEGGRRIRKNWTSSFVVLTDVFLLFYKDIRSAHLANPGIKPELCIDLNGALIDWCPEKSSRKNVFQISTVLGHQLLLQDDNAQTTKEWFDTIHAAIMVLPSSLEQTEAKYSDDSLKRDIKLSRSKSTKQYSSNKGNEDTNLSIPAEKKRKIRDKLRQFFVRRPTMESLREKGIIMDAGNSNASRLVAVKTDEPVFGCLLENLCLRECRPVPKFVVKCIETIEKKELTADGLYRASGNLSQVQKIRVHVNQDDYSCLSEEEDVHVITGALKMFFREMKEPLFPFHMFDSFLYAIALPDASSKLEALKELVYKLPEPNFETLKFLLEHLLRVTEFHKQNRMQVQNLAIVFGPTLMWPEQVSSNIALDMMHQNRIVEFLLLEFHAIFSRSHAS